MDTYELLELFSKIYPMQVHLKRNHGISVGLRRIKRIMNFMRIEPTLPKKDAYKNQVAYNHPMSCPDNKLEQNFFIGPRKVVLTDITYIYYINHNLRNSDENSLM